MSPKKTRQASPSLSSTASSKAPQSPQAPAVGSWGLFKGQPAIVVNANPLTLTVFSANGGVNGVKGEEAQAAFS